MHTVGFSSRNVIIAHAQSNRQFPGFPADMAQNAGCRSTGRGMHFAAARFIAGNPACGIDLTELNRRYNSEGLR